MGQPWGCRTRAVAALALKAIFARLALCRPRASPARKVCGVGLAPPHQRALANALQGHGVAQPLR